jgi:cell division protease FtsH
LGPINFGPQTDATEWGKSFYEQQTISQEMQSAIDREVKKFLDTAYAKAFDIVKKYRKDLDKVAEELMKKETLEGDDFVALLGGDKKRI